MLFAGRFRQKCTFILLAISYLLQVLRESVLFFLLVRCHVLMKRPTWSLDCVRFAYMFAQVTPPRLHLHLFVVIRSCDRPCVRMAVTAFLYLYHVVIGAVKQPLTIGRRQYFDDSPALSHQTSLLSSLRLGIARRNYDIITGLGS